MQNNLKRKIGSVILAFAAVLLTGCAMGGATGKQTQKGTAALDAGEYQEAAGYFSKAVTEGEEPMLAYRGLGIAYMGLADYAKSESAFELALDNADEKSPENIEDIRLYLATAQYRQEAFDEVIITCDEIFTADKGDRKEKCSDAYYLRGASYLHENQPDEAEADFAMAVSIEPNNYDLYLNIYECYHSLNLSGLGASYLQSALDIQGDELENYYNRGRIYYYLENYDAAQSELIGPVEAKYVPAMKLIAKVYLAQEDYEHAMAVYEQLEEESGESSAVYNGYAVCEIARGNLDKALEYIAEGLKVAQGEERQELSFNEIVVFEKMQDYTTAKAKAKDYVNRYPSDEAGQKEYTFLQTRK